LIDIWLVEDTALHCINMTNTFRYPPIKGETIRLLLVFPGNDNDSLVCGIFSTGIYSSPPYNAISYAWGDPKPTRNLMLNGEHFCATESSHQALRAVRQQDSGILLWIDSICIDQSNADEKGHQVHRMSLIYSRAHQVIAWLGEPVQDVSKAFSLLNAFELLLPRISVEGGCIHQVWTAFDQFFDTANLKALGNLFALPWFTRLWVLQEVILARSLQLRCGLFRATWSSLYLMMDVWKSVYHKNPTMQKEELSFGGKGIFYFMMALVDADFQSARSNNIRLSLVKLTTQSALLKASNPKDRIYGLLGLLQHSVPSGDKEPKVNYKLSCGEIYHQATMWSIRHDNNFDVLSLCTTSGKHLRGMPYRTPFWVPDFANPNISMIFRIGNKFTDYCAGGFVSITEGEDYKFFEDNRILAIKGFIVDSIIKKGSKSPEYSLSEDFKAQQELWMAEAASMLESYEKSHGLEGSRAGELPRVLRADRTLLGLELEDLNNTCIRGVSGNLTATLPCPGRDPSWANFELHTSIATKGKHFVITESGDMGLVNSWVEVGNQICILPSAKIPLVIRPQVEGKTLLYLIMDGCYMHGLMNGEGCRGQKQWISFF
jgi:hypothetical protein